MSKTPPKPVLFDFYNPWREPVHAPHDPVSMTRQEFAEECDVNRIMDRYERTGVWPPVPLGQEPRYMDVTEVPDLMYAMNFLKDAEAAFMSLPAKVRREFENNPVAFVDYASDPANIDQMREWGLAPPAPVEAPPASPAPPPASPAPAAPPAAPPPGGAPTKP